MKIHWENIHWMTDDVGTSWATLADGEHNSLTLESRDDTITFHADGSPRFEIGEILDLATLCLILSRNALPDRIDEARRSDHGTPTSAGPDVLVPEQRQESLPEQHDTSSRACQLTRPPQIRRWSQATGLGTISAVDSSLGVRGFG
jgi:hypothetical protein